MGVGALTARGEARPGEEGPRGEAGAGLSTWQWFTREADSLAAAGAVSRRPAARPSPAGASATFQSGAARPEAPAGPAWDWLVDGPPPELAESPLVWAAPRAPVFISKCVSGPSESWRGHLP